MFQFKSEQELRITQSEFDRQAEITRLLLEGISSTHVSVYSLGIHLKQKTLMVPRHCEGGKLKFKTFSVIYQGNLNCSAFQDI